MDEVPALDEHARAILTELGYDSETIDLLVTENAI
jgi:crotonobetainyl-CoA:carnitine CoA-transferase CaiB-like acyl-CoA transferase